MSPHLAISPIFHAFQGLRVFGLRIRPDNIDGDALLRVIKRHGHTHRYGTAWLECVRWDSGHSSLPLRVVFCRATVLRLSPDYGTRNAVRLATLAGRGRKLIADSWLALGNWAAVRHFVARRN